jgi:Putative adhesin
MTSSLPMTPGRWLALIIGTPLALLAIGYTALTAVAFAGLGSYRVSLATPVAGRIAAVSMNTGDLTVRPGPAGQLRLRGTLRYSLIQPQVSWRRSASTITIHSGCRVPAGLCLLDYTATVPAGSRPEISDGSGDLTASGVAGTFTLTDGSGSITATRISGTPTIRDASGDITVTSLSGSRAVITDDSGSISVSGVSSRQLSVSDQLGDISVVFTKVPDKVQVTDSSGSISLVLPPGPTAYRVSASTSSGSTSITVPRSLTSPHLISVTDQSGDITITQ